MVIIFANVMPHFISWTKFLPAEVEEEGGGEFNKSFSYQETPPLCSILVCILNFDNKTGNHIWLTIWPFVHE